MWTFLGFTLLTAIACAPEDKKDKKIILNSDNEDYKKGDAVSFIKEQYEEFIKFDSVSKFIEHLNKSPKIDADQKKYLNNLLTELGDKKDEKAEYLVSYIDKSNFWLYLIIGMLLVIVANIGIYFIMKRRNANAPGELGE